MSRVTQTAVSSLASLALGLVGYTKGGLIVGALAGQAATAAVLWYQCRADVRPLWSLVSKARLREVARAYDALPKANAPQALLEALRENAITVAIASLFGAAANGLFALAMRILKAPIQLVGISVSQVFFQRAAETRNAGGDLRRLTMKTMGTLALLSAPVFLAVAVFGPQGFAFVFGERWRMAGEYARLLTPWLFVWFVAFPVSWVPQVTGHQRGALAFAVADVATKLAGLSVGLLGGGIRAGLLALAVLGALVGVAQIRWYVAITKDAPGHMDTAAVGGMPES